MNERPEMIGGDEPPLFTVAICTRNRDALLDEALASVEPQLLGDAELLVIDNGSTDGTPGCVVRWAGVNPRIRGVVESELGLSVARNTALRSARGGWIVFLDDDATAEPGWLDAFRRAVRSPVSPSQAAFGGPVIPRYEGDRPFWVGAEENGLDMGGDVVEFTGRCGPWGGNAAYNRRIASAVGGFDPSLGRKGDGLASHEEMDLFERIKLQGGTAWYLPNARIRHLVPRSRMRLGVQLRIQFASGRSSAICRMKLLNSPSERFFFRLVRCLVAIPHSLLSWAAALLFFLVGRRVHAASSLFKGTRNAGFGWQSLLGARA